MTKIDYNMIFSYYYYYYYYYYYLRNILDIIITSYNNSLRIVSFLRRFNNRRSICDAILQYIFFNTVKNQHRIT